MPLRGICLITYPLKIDGDDIAVEVLGSSPLYVAALITQPIIYELQTVFAAFFSKGGVPIVKPPDHIGRYSREHMAKGPFPIALIHII